AVVIKILAALHFEAGLLQKVCNSLRVVDRIGEGRNFLIAGIANHQRDALASLCVPGGDSRKSQCQYAESAKSHGGRVHPPNFRVPYCSGAEQVVAGVETRS